MITGICFVLLVATTSIALAWMTMSGIHNGERSERQRIVRNAISASKREKYLKQQRTKIISEDREQIIGDGACGWTDLKSSTPRSARIRDMGEVRGV